jgi:hypothetical protein
MLQTLFGVLLIAFPTQVTAEVPLVRELEIPTVHTEIVSLEVNLDSTTTIKKYVMEQARLKSVDEELVNAIIVCESNYVAKQSEWPDKAGPNGKEDSWGIWQWNLKHNPQITREQAMDIEWSTNWSLDQIKSGFTSWSCWPK